MKQNPSLENILKVYSNRILLKLKSLFNKLATKIKKQKQKEINLSSLKIRASLHFNSSTESKLLKQKTLTKRKYTH